MIWPFRRRAHDNGDDVVEEVSEEVAQAEQMLQEAEDKLAETRAKIPELAKAVASARRVHYKVDRFTKEIADSFGRLNHG